MSFISEMDYVSTSTDSLSSTENIGTSKDNDTFSILQQHEYCMLKLNMEEITKSTKRNNNTTN